MGGLVHKQHFVPAGYLRAWKVGGDSFFIVDKHGGRRPCNEKCKHFWMYNLYDAVNVEWMKTENGKSHKSENICKLMYPESGIIQRENYIEHRMKIDEDKFYSLRHKLNHDVYHMSYEDWNFLIWFLCLMICRNPYYCNMFDVFMDFQKIGLLGQGDYCSNMSLVPIATLIHDTRCLYRKIKGFRRCLFTSGDVPFYTSDRPVVDFSDGSYFFSVNAVYFYFRV